MAERLAGAGRPLVLWSRDQEKTRSLGDRLGIPIAASPAEAVAGCELVLSSLADDEAVGAVYLGRSGVVEGVEPGAVVMETSTIDPETSRRVGDRVDESGASFLDAPVSGSVSTVEAGNLTVMVGGDRSVMERVLPALQPIAARVIHIGPRGSGSAAKLAVNSLVHALNVALSEALVLAEKAGVERKVAYEVFAGGAAGAPFVAYKRKAYEHPDSAEVAFSLELVRKDLDLITGLAARVGAPLNQAHAGLDIVNRAIAAGMADRDMSAIAVFLRGEEG